MLCLFDTRLFPFFPRAVNQVVWGTTDMPANVVHYHRFIHAIAGATIAGWGVALAFIAHYPFRNRERWAWWAIAAAVMSWFTLDTTFSLYFGVWPNAIFNLGAFIALATPLAFTYRAVGAKREPRDA